MKIVYLTIFVLLFAITKQDKVDAAKLKLDTILGKTVFFAGNIKHTRLSDSKEVENYYWHFASTGSDTLVVWIGSDIGLSSIYTALAQNGPFSIDGTGTPKVNINSWVGDNKPSLIYFDAQNLGFSSTRDEQFDEDKLSIDIANGIMKLIEAQAIGNKRLFIAGEYQAGYLIPMVVERISQKVSDKVEGMLIGNPCTDPSDCKTDKPTVYQAQFLYNKGYIGKAQLDSFSKNCANLASPECATEQNNVNTYIKNFNDLYKFTNDDTTQMEKWLNDNKASLFATGPTFKAYSVNAKVTYTGKDTLGLYPVLMSKPKLRVQIFSGLRSYLLPTESVFAWVDKLRIEKGLGTLEYSRGWFTANKFSGSVWTLDGISIVNVVGVSSLSRSTFKNCPIQELFMSFVNNQPLKYN